jgi:hypothetical protein
LDRKGIRGSGRRDGPFEGEAREEKSLGVEGFAPRGRRLLRAAPGTLAAATSLAAFGFAAPAALAGELAPSRFPG